MRFLLLTLIVAVSACSECEVRGETPDGVDVCYLAEAEYRYEPEYIDRALFLTQLQFDRAVDTTLYQVRFREPIFDCSGREAVGCYTPDGNVSYVGTLNARLSRTAFVHEFVHHLLDETEGDPNGAHDHPFWERVPIINAQLAEQTE